MIFCDVLPTPQNVLWNAALDIDTSRVARGLGIIYGICKQLLKWLSFGMVLGIQIQGIVWVPYRIHSPLFHSRVRENDMFVIVKGFWYCYVVL